MPSIRQIELKGESIETTLARSKRDLLPEVLRSDPLAQWILEFDRPPGERRHGYHRHDVRDPMLAMMVKELSERVVEPTLSFYHGSLMHFGQQWGVTEEGLARARALLESDNLARSVKDVEARSAQPRGRARVVRFAHNLADAWGERMNNLTRAWDTWRGEVQELKKAINRAEDSLAEPYDRPPIEIFDLVGHCLEPSRLSHHGFPDRREMTLGHTISLVALAGLLTLSRDRWGRGPYDLEYLLRDLMRVDEKRAGVPIIVEEIRALEAEYAGSDPFDPYRSEFKPADQALHRLAIHNTLHHSEPSRWLREYRSTLRTLSAWPFPDAPTEGDRQQRWVEWGAITADAEIKEDAVDGHKAFHPNAAQASFERGWVRQLAGSLFKKGAKPDAAEALGFYALVREVAIALAERGNAIVAPAEERLRTLVERIARDGYSHGDW